MKISSLKTAPLNQNNYNKNKLTPEFIGSLVAFPVGYTNEKCLPCDGYKLKIIDYKQLFSVIGLSFNDGTEENDEFRIPDYNITKRFLQPGTEATKIINAGLPYVDLALRVDGGNTVKQYYCNSYMGDYGTDDYGGVLKASTDGKDEFMFQMSKASKNRKAGDLIFDTNIYGKSPTVQPPSQIVNICIRYK